MTLRYRQNQMDRIRDGLCSDEACVLYSEKMCIRDSTRALIKSSR